MKEMLEVAQDYGLQIHKEGSVIRAFCPFHDDTKKPNFTIYKDSWFCFACSIGGDVPSFVAKIEGISYADASQKLKGSVNVLEESMATLEGLQFNDHGQYNVATNIQISEMCRNLMYSNPEKVDKVLEFLKRLDQELAQPMTLEKMQKLMDEVSTL